MKCAEHPSLKEEERGGEDRKDGGEGGGEGEVGRDYEETVRLEQQPGKPTTTSTTEENAGVTRYEETQPNQADSEERSIQESGGGEKTNTDETGRKESNLPEQCDDEEGITEREGKEADSTNESSGKTQQPQHVYWGVTRGGELPPSVSVCFEASPSLLARVQGRLLSLLGRANRYCLPQNLPAPPGMPLEVLRKKVKEARHKLFHHSRPSSSKCSQKDKSSASESSSMSESSAPAVSPRGSGGGCKRVEEPLQKYWGGEEGGGAAGVEEEIELLQQYLNLQHLARSRKHSAQLRRIRDSLLLQVRSRPNSVVTVHDPAPARPDQAPRNDRQQLRDFLLDIGFVQDYSTLNRHGYDLATAAHMDALDLAGAGVTEPLHRMALKHELNLVQRPTQVPEEVPETVEQWLEGLGLMDYVDNFHLNGIYCPLAALNLTKRDLQLMGVYMQGHRKKILLSLTALKESLFRRQ